MVTSDSRTVAWWMDQIESIDGIGMTELSKIEWTVLRSFATSLRGILKNMKEGAWGER